MKLSLFLSLLVCSSGCAAANVANTPPQQTTVPAVRPAQFSVAPALFELSPTCRAQEPAAPNALDDDCDGAIDGQRDETATVTLAYRRDAPLRVVLQGPDGSRAIDARCELPSVCIARVRSDDVSPGRYELRIESTAAGAEGLPTSVAVSKSGQGEVRTYLAELTQPGEAKPLGTFVRE